MRLGFPEEAEQIFERGLRETNDADTPRLQADLIYLLSNQGRYKEVRAFAENRLVSSHERYWEISETVQNFREAIQLAKAQGAEVWITTYPTQPLQPLQDAVGTSDGVHFLSFRNEFDKAVAEKGLDAIYRDRMMISWGHFSDEGSRIWANLIFQNIRDHLKK